MADFENSSSQTRRRWYYFTPTGLVCRYLLFFYSNPIPSGFKINNTGRRLSKAVLRPKIEQERPLGGLAKYLLDHLIGRVMSLALCNCTRCSFRDFADSLSRASLLTGRKE